MKKKLLIIFTAVLCLTTTGCLKRDTMEDIDIITSSYAIEYVTNELYGNNAKVKSIYPDGTDINKYKFNNKQIKDYSNKDLFIYVGLSDAKDIAKDLLNKNNDILIIDSSYGMEYKYDVEELWLNPSNLQMISQNVKKGLEEYINSSYLKKGIDENYDNLKVKLSELDAEFKVTYENSSTKTLIVNNDVLKFLEKYGFEVISLDEDTITDKAINDATDKIISGQNKYIFMLENDKETDTIKNLKQNHNVETVTFRNLSSITDEERNNSEDYIKIMNNNLEIIKKETYK